MSSHADTPEAISAIQAVGLKKAFGPVVALRGVDLTLEKGVFYVILGPNGAGKTTLLRTFATLCKPTAGTLSLLGRPAFQETQSLRSELGVISHQLYLFPNLTGAENLKFYGRLYGLSDLKGHVSRALAEVDLEAEKGRLVKTYSRGMQQRLSIARALIHRPSIVLLDEPFTGLDHGSSLSLANLLLGLRDGNRTFVMVTHNLPQALVLGDRAGFLVRGRLVREVSLKGLTLPELTEYYQRVGG